MESWTDERLDDLAAALSPLPERVAQVTEAVDRLTAEVRSVGADLTAEIGSVRSDLSASQRQITQIGWGLVGALMAALVALSLALV
jgi:hypothetical protein